MSLHNLLIVGLTKWISSTSVLVTDHIMFLDFLGLLISWQFLSEHSNLSFFVDWLLKSWYSHFFCFVWHLLARQLLSFAAVFFNYTSSLGFTGHITTLFSTWQFLFLLWDCSPLEHPFSLLDCSPWEYLFAIFSALVFSLVCCTLNLD